MSSFDYSDPKNCRLHAGRLTGGLYYSPRTDGCYSMYAPSCTGCTIGEAETAMFARRNAMYNAYAIVSGSSGQTAENVWLSIETISHVLINGVEEAEMRDAICFLNKLLGLKGLSVADRGGPITSSDVLGSITETGEKRKACALIGAYIKQGGFYRLEEAATHLASLYK